MNIEIRLDFTRVFLEKLFHSSIRLVIDQNLHRLFDGSNSSDRKIKTKVQMIEKCFREEKLGDSSLMKRKEKRNEIQLVAAAGFGIIFVFPSSGSRIKARILSSLAFSASGPSETS